MISTGAGIVLVAAGAILRFAVTTTSTHGLNVHVVGVIVMLAGAARPGAVATGVGPADRRRNRPGSYGRGSPSLTRQRRVYQDQPPR